MELVDRLALDFDLVDRHLPLPIQYSAEAGIRELINRMSKLANSSG